MEWTFWKKCSFLSCLLSFSLYKYRQTLRLNEILCEPMRALGVAQVTAINQWEGAGLNVSQWTAAARHRYVSAFHSVHSNLANFVGHLQKSRITPASYRYQSVEEALLTSGFISVKISQQHQSEWTQSKGDFPLSLPASEGIEDKWWQIWDVSCCSSSSPSDQS